MTTYQWPHHRKEVTLLCSQLPANRTLCSGRASQHLPIHNKMLTSSILHRYWASSHSYCELTGTMTMLDKQKNVTQHSSPSSKSYILFILSSAVFTVYLVPFRTEYLTNCGIYQMPWLQVGTAGKLSLEPLKLFNIFYFIRILFSLLIPLPYLSLCMDICVYLCI